MKQYAVTILVLCLLHAVPTKAWSFSFKMSRRALVKRAAACLVASSAVATQSPLPAHAAATAISTNNPLDSIAQAQSTLTTLLENWTRATVECNFADVPRELLEQKNKELLLEKATTSALFDKSASVETCKTTNRIVRDYLGVTGKGPLVGMEKKLKLAMEFVQGDRMEDYMAGKSVGWS